MTSRRTVVFFGTYDADSHPRIRVLAEGLAAAGNEVVEVCEPLDVPTHQRVSMLARPWLAPRFAFRVLAAWFRLWRRARRLGPPDAVVVGYLGHFDVHLARRLFRAPIVLDHLVGLADTARDRAGDTRRWLLRLLERIDRCALGAADLVVFDTVEQQAVSDSLAPSRGVVVPVGAASAWFEAAATGVHPRLRVIYVGVYTPLHGATDIGRAIASLRHRDDIEFTMVGSGQDRPATEAATAGSPHVSWHDWVDAAELPAVVGSHDVCLGIFGTGPKARRVVPNKVYQGAAAGCVVITSDTEPQRRSLDGVAVLVPPGDPAALAAAIERLADDRSELDRRRRDTAAVAEDRFRPVQVVAPLVSALDDIGATRG